MKNHPIVNKYTTGYNWKKLQSISTRQHNGKRQWREYLQPYAWATSIKLVSRRRNNEKVTRITFSASDSKQHKAPDQQTTTTKHLLLMLSKPGSPVIAWQADMDPGQSGTLMERGGGIQRRGFINWIIRLHCKTIFSGAIRSQTVTLDFCQYVKGTHGACNLTP